MEVNDVLSEALVLVGRADAAESIAGENTATEEVRYCVQTVLHCLNAVLDEIARTLFPLRRQEEITPQNNKIAYTELERNPVKIHSVTRDGTVLKTVVFPTYMAVNCQNAVVVDYNCSPRKACLGALCDVDEYHVGQSTVAMGVASEYCLINGLCAEAENWEKKYRTALEESLRSARGNGGGGVVAPTAPAGYLPKRSWV